VQSLPTQSTAACDIVLVSCYELGHEPLGVLTAAGVLDRAGLAARVIDVAVDDFDPASVADTSLVAISTPMHTALRLGARVAARVREVNPDAHICFVGLYAELHHQHLVPALADTWLGAEFEADLLELSRAVRARGAASARTVALPRAPRSAGAIKERELSLAPRRVAAPHDARYTQLQLNGRYQSTAYVATTRGCKHTCTHCPIPAAYHGRFYSLPLEQVLTDIDAAVALGARHVTFADADFLNGPTHSLRIAREMHHRHPGVTFDYTAKIEHLLRQGAAVDELQSLGNIFVVSAVESFNNDVLTRLDKGHSDDDAITVIRDFNRRGLTLRPSLVPFTPWETRESLARLFEIVAGEGLVTCIDTFQRMAALAAPGRALRIMAKPGDPPRLTEDWFC